MEVIKRFRDKNTKKIYSVGSDYKADKQRVDELTKKGYLKEGVKTPFFSAMTKDEIIKELKNKNIEFSSKSTKKELIELLEGE